MSACEFVSSKNFNNDQGKGLDQILKFDNDYKEVGDIILDSKKSPIRSVLKIKNFFIFQIFI